MAYSESSDGSRKRQRTSDEHYDGAGILPVEAGVGMMGAGLTGFQHEAGDGGDGSDIDEDGRDKKTGRRKIKIEFISDKSRRHITFSKRKAGIMKKAYELSTLTGTQVLLLVVSETGLVYTFTTSKLQPLVTQPEGKNLIQACLNAPQGQPPPGNYMPGPPHPAYPQQIPPPPHLQHGGMPQQTQIAHHDDDNERSVSPHGPQAAASNNGASAANGGHDGPGARRPRRGAPNGSYREASSEHEAHPASDHGNGGPVDHGAAYPNGAGYAAAGDDIPQAYGAYGNGTWPGYPDRR